MTYRVGLVLLTIFALVRSAYGTGNGRSVSKFPFAAQIVLSCRGFISGSIIHKRFVLTSALDLYYLHNLDPIPRKLLKVVVGHGRTLDTGTQYSVERIIFHPSFKNRCIEDPNNLALIKLREPIHFTDNVKPVPLAKRNPPCGKKGWVYSHSFAREAETRVKYPKSSYEYSLRGEKLKATSPGHWKNDGLIIFTMSEADGSPPCSKNSGRPYVIDGQLVGVDITHTQKCGKLSDVMGFASVPDHRKWIQNVIKKNLPYE